MELDPISYAGHDANLYRSVGDAPRNGVDSQGLTLPRPGGGPPVMPWEVVGWDAWQDYVARVSGIRDIADSAFETRVIGYNRGHPSLFFQNNEGVGIDLRRPSL
jgi:hypothetical protein